jgi:hypothetical protein
MKILRFTGKLSPNSKLGFKRISTIIFISGLFLIWIHQKADHVVEVEKQARIENQKKIDAQISAQERQQKKARQKDQFLLEIAEYRLGLLNLDPGSRFIENVYAPFSNVPVVYVQMSDEFAYQKKIERLQLAQTLHQLWQQKSTDTAILFYLVDRNQNRLSEMDWGKIVIEE